MDGMLAYTARLAILATATLGFSACNTSMATAPSAIAAGVSVPLGASRLLQSAPERNDLHRRPGVHSYMLPQAKAQDLMYVSDSEADVVYVYTYPGGKPAGAIAAPNPQGLCADTKGNIWVMTWSSSEALEYSHGGTTPIVTLTLPNQILAGCSVDQSSGSVAITSWCQFKATGTCDAPGSVFVYKDVKKTPTQYGIPDAAEVYFCGFDPKGNLFVDAVGASAPFVLGELRRGSSTMDPITLDRPVYFPGNVQWDGTYLAIGDQLAGNQLVSSIHQVKLKGNNGTVVGTTKLLGTTDVAQFWIQGSSVVAPNIGLASNDARVYPYSAGGSPTQIFGAGSFENPIGAAVSLASKK